MILTFLSNFRSSVHTIQAIPHNPDKSTLFRLVRMSALMRTKNDDLGKNCALQTAKGITPTEIPPLQAYTRNEISHPSGDIFFLLFISFNVN